MDTYKNILSHICSNALSVANLDRYSIFQHMIQAFSKQYMEKQPCITLLQESIKLSLTSLHHTYNLPMYHNCSYDYNINSPTLHVKYNESIAQLIIYLLCSNAIQTNIDIQHCNLLSDRDIVSIIGYSALSNRLYLDDTLLEHICSHTYQSHTIYDIELLYQRNIKSIVLYLFLSLTTILYTSSFTSQNIALIRHVSESFAEMYINIYHRKQNTYETIDACIKNDTLFIQQKNIFIKRLQELKLWNMDVEQIAIYLEKQYYSNAKWKLQQCPTINVLENVDIS